MTTHHVTARLAEAPDGTTLITAFIPGKHGWGTTEATITLADTPGVTSCEEPE